jgi:transposase InsO family protein
LDVRRIPFRLLSVLLKREKNETEGAKNMKDIELDYHREEGLKKFALVAPLLEDGLSLREASERRQKILEQGEISERTLRRWISAYRKRGFEGLVKKARKDKGICKAIAPEALILAEECRRELPRRSAGLIQDWLKTQGHEVARSTLSRHLRAKGLSGRDLRAEKEAKAGTRRFVRIGRNSLWQTDLKYGPYLHDPEHPGKKRRTYLLAIIDDATRAIPHAEFYHDQKLPILEDALRKAIQRNGSPKRIYVDNGKIFVSTWMRLACAKLNIKHINAAPYNPEGKGKIERFNRTVEEFLGEYSLQEAGTLEELNTLFRGWLSERYQHKPHSSLNGKTPLEAFSEDSTPLRFHSLETLQDAFLHEAERTVDKSGCLKLEGKLYDAGRDFLRKKVTLRYDPFDMEVLQLWYKGTQRCLIREAHIGESNATLKAPAEKLDSSGESRILNTYKEEQQKRFTKTLGAYGLRETLENHEESTDD